MRIDMEFTESEAVTMLRNVGLDVQPENAHIESETMLSKVWMVTNPHNGEKQPMWPLFYKYISVKKAELFLNPGRLEILNLFDK
jgi:hypothetical protein